LLPSGEEKENRIKLGLLMDGKKRKTKAIYREVNRF
jgi:hypothetical protein